MVAAAGVDDPEAAAAGVFADGAGAGELPVAGGLPAGADCTGCAAAGGDPGSDGPD
jgi:hypothetical protein